ncbi:MAG: helix-turn-helix transcriptional regulator [Alphaproteobacteria bacterium]|nr:helix-turn-helix transcriptional regulator [Alphaproteobacteria bacterium]
MDSPPDMVLERAIELLYEAITDSSRWQEFLNVCANAFDAKAASIIITDAQVANGVYSALYNLNPDQLAKAIQHGQTDLRVLYSMANPGRPFSDYLVMPHDELDRSPMAVDCLIPNGLRYTLGVSFVDETTMSAVGFYRRRQDAIFDESDLRRMGRLVPHLRRAIRLVVQFLRLEQEKWAALEVLNTMPMGLAIADAQSHLLHANTAAQRILEAGDGLLFNHGRLWGNTSDASEALRSAIACAVDGSKPHQALAITRQAGTPLFLRIASLHRNEMAGKQIALPQPVAALYITDPDRPQETMLELLQRLYGLTPREVELAALIARGERLDACAANMNISIPTAKTHLQSVFGKTGAATQADLVRLVLSAPVWEHASAPGT